MLNYASTLSSDGTVRAWGTKVRTYRIHFVTLEIHLCRLLCIISKTGHFCAHYARFPRFLCAVPCMRITDWTFTGDRPINELYTCLGFFGCILIIAGIPVHCLKQLLEF